MPAQSSRSRYDIGDLAYAGRYVSTGGTDEPVAGDFYDVLNVSEELVALAVGDVAGHGSAVLPQMQQLREALRRFVREDPDPGSVVARADVFWDHLDSDSIATVWYGLYEVRTGGLTYVSAGHPPPVLTVHGDPSRLLLPASAPPLGAGVLGLRGEEQREVLPAGAVLVAYSDGLIERRGTDFDEQLAVLQSIVTKACDPAKGGTARHIADEIVDTLLPDPDRAEDDVCVLVVFRHQPLQIPEVG